MEVKPDVEISSSLAAGEKILTSAVLHCRRGPAGGVCPKGRLGRGVEGYSQLQPDSPAGGGWPGDCELPDVRLL